MKQVVVAGGAGYLGQAICRGLSEAGYSVLCLSSKVPPEETQCDFAVIDCANEKLLSSRIENWLGSSNLDGFVNCAGRGLRGIDLDMPAETFRSGIETLTLQFTCARTVARYMNGGSIVNIGSLWGLKSPDPSMYLDLKNEPSIATPCVYGGVAQLNKYLAVLLAPNVRVNLVVPGWFPKPSAKPRPDYIDGITSRTPMGRIGRPNDLVGAVEFLLSPASSFMTGQQIVVDGGYSIL